MLKTTNQSHSASSIYIYIYIYRALTSLFLLLLPILATVLASPSVSAAGVDYNVIIDPSLTISLTSNLVTLNLNPVSKPFDNSSTNVLVSTNNATGYYMTMSTTSGDTNLVNNNSTPSDDTDDSYIPTLPTSGEHDCSSGCTESNFPTNYWGYKIASINNVATNNYIPFTSGVTVRETIAPAADDTTTLTFASKVDYDTKAGLYATTLNFTAVTKPVPVYMQYMTPSACTTTPRIVTDIRDGGEYYVARLADGKCWMIQNLRLGQGLETTTGSMTLTSEDSNVDSDFVLTGKGSFPQIYIEDPGLNQDYRRVWDGSAFYCNNDYGCYYNWYTATASSGTSEIITNSQNVNFSICPKNWVLPTGGPSTASHESDFYSLIEAYGYSSAASASTVINYILVDPKSATENFNGAYKPGFTLTGAYYDKTPPSVPTYSGMTGYYWSSTNNSASTAYFISLSPDNSNIYSIINVGARYGKATGRSVRCLLQE